MGGGAWYFGPISLLSLNGCGGCSAACVEFRFSLSKRVKSSKDRHKLRHPIFDGQEEDASGSGKVSQSVIHKGHPLQT